MSRTHCYHRYLVAAGLPSANEGGNILSFFESNKADHVVAATVSHSFSIFSFPVGFHNHSFLLGFVLLTHVQYLLSSSLPPATSTNWRCHLPLSTHSCKRPIPDGKVHHDAVHIGSPLSPTIFTSLSLLCHSSTSLLVSPFSFPSPSLFPPTSVVPLLHIYPHLHPRSP